ncbi:hypothetical protein PSPO01_03306 [Paraphaeosphaeria sporulosa]
MPPRILTVRRQARSCTHFLAAASTGAARVSASSLSLSISVKVPVLDAMKGRHFIGRVLHVLLVLSLIYTLLRLLYWSFSRLADDAQQGNFAPHPASDVDSAEPEKLSPQKIAESLNTLWLSYDLDHCRNVCEASRVACRLRDCWYVQGVKSWD